jgi:hypothetical protein
VLLTKCENLEGKFLKMKNTKTLLSFFSMNVDYLGWLSLMSTLEESLVANSGSTKVWVMDPSLFDV